MGRGVARDRHCFWTLLRERLLFSCCWPFLAPQRRGTTLCCEQVLRTLARTSRVRPGCVLVLVDTRRKGLHAAHHWARANPGRLGDAPYRCLEPTLTARAPAAAAQRQLNLSVAPESDVCPQASTSRSVAWGSWRCACAAKLARNLQRDLGLLRAGAGGWVQSRQQHMHHRSSMLACRCSRAQPRKLFTPSS